MKRREWLRVAAGALAAVAGPAVLAARARASGRSPAGAAGPWTAAPGVEGPGGAREPGPASSIPRTPFAPLGLQLYTVRDLMAEDVAGTLRAVAEIGFEEVELAGLHGLTPAAMRRMLDDAGLVAPSAHVGLDVLRDDLERALDEASATGYRKLIVPWLDAAERTADGYHRVAEELNRAGARAGERGLVVGYHNHDFEMSLVGRRRGWDILLEETDPALVEMQMDVFWAVHGGVDPVAYLEAHPGRFTTLHAKDRTPDGQMVAVGEGAIDFRALLAAARKNGLEHVFVEHDEPADPLESIRVSRENLATLEV